MDKARLEQLIKKHHNNAFLCACKCGHCNEEEVLEALQQAQVNIVKGKVGFTERLTIKAWLFSL